MIWTTVSTYTAGTLIRSDDDEPPRSSVTVGVRAAERVSSCGSSAAPCRSRRPASPCARRASSWRFPPSSRRRSSRRPFSRARRAQCLSAPLFSCRRPASQARPAEILSFPRPFALFAGKFLLLQFKNGEYFSGANGAGNRSGLSKTLTCENSRMRYGNVFAVGAERQTFQRPVFRRRF